MVSPLSHGVDRADNGDRPGGDGFDDVGDVEVAEDAGEDVFKGAAVEGRFDDGLVRLEEAVEFDGGDAGVEGRREEDGEAGMADADGGDLGRGEEVEAEVVDNDLADDDLDVDEDAETNPDDDVDLGGDDDIGLNTTDDDDEN